MVSPELVVERAEQWLYGSLGARSRPEDPTRAADWAARVDRPLSARELKRLRCSVARGQPFGEETWVDRTARRLGLEASLRPEGRPPKDKDPKN